MLATSSLGDKVKEAHQILHFWVHLFEVLEVLEILFSQTITDDLSKLTAAAALWDEIHETEQILHFWRSLLEVYRPEDRDLRIMRVFMIVVGWTAGGLWTAYIRYASVDDVHFLFGCEGGASHFRYK